MALTQIAWVVSVLVAVALALPQHQFFGQVHQQPGQFYVVPETHSKAGIVELAPMVPVGPVAVPLAVLLPSKPVKSLMSEQEVLEGSVKPVEVMLSASDARKPDFAALLNKIPGLGSSSSAGSGTAATVTQTVTSTFYTYNSDYYNNNNNNNNIGYTTPYTYTTTTTITVR